MSTTDTAGFAENLGGQGEYHLRRGAYAEAARAFRRALERLPAQGSEPQLRQRIDWTIGLAKCNSYDSPLENVTLLKGVLPIARKLLDRRRTALVLYALGVDAFILGNINQTLSYASECVDSAHPNDDRDLVTLCSNLSGRAYVLNGRYESAIASLNRYLARGEQGNAEERAWCEGYLCLAHAFRAEFDQALAHGDTGLAVARQTESLPREMAAILYGLMARNLRGDWPGVLERADFRLELQKPGNPRPRVLEATRRSFAGYALAMSKDLDAGHESIQSAIADIGATGALHSMSFHHALFAEICVRKGELDRAQESAERSLARTHVGERFAETIAYRALGLCAAARGLAAWPRAEEYLLHSVALADARGGKANAAVGRYHLAQLEAKRGDRSSALRHLTAAKQTFIDRDMPSWLQAAAGLEL